MTRGIHFGVGALSVSTVAIASFDSLMNKCHYIDRLPVSAFVIRDGEWNEGSKGSGRTPTDGL